VNIIVDFIVVRYQSSEGYKRLGIAMTDTSVSPIAKRPLEAEQTGLDVGNAPSEVKARANGG
jgi:hypothetical protein